MNPKRRVVVVGGGAAGFFAAITCAEKLGEAGEVTLLEATPHLLSKVRISGGGRCNVTHACFDPAELIKKYPRGGRELLGAFHRFQPRDTIQWFAKHGVETKTEADGRMFPTSDNSESIVRALMQAAEKAGVTIQTQTGVRQVEKTDEGFKLTLSQKEERFTDRLILATGGNQSSGGLAIAESLGHTIIPPVPSLFTFHIKDSRLEGLAGLSVDHVEVSVPGTKLKTDGPLLITHWGMSGPAILKLSAWGARLLAEAKYQFTLVVHWTAPQTTESLYAELDRLRIQEARKQVSTFSPFKIPQRLWERLILAAGIATTTPWAHLSNIQLKALISQISASTFKVEGKSLFKEEFVTCGGVKCSEVDFRTMESKCCPHLYFAGEVLDIDGVTGGFNFQNAWTTGWLAGQACAE